jgi:hypothetical protein
MNYINELNITFKKYINYKTINNYNSIQMRNMPNGIQLVDTFLYCFKYAQLNATKEGIVSQLNTSSDKNFTRHAYDTKLKNLPVNVFESLFEEIRSICYHMTISYNKNNPHFRPIAVDGTYNLNSDYGLILNMGYYDTLNNIPVELNFGKTSDQNLEVNKFKEQVLMDLESFKDVIFICDRLYFTYDLLEFLILHNLKFIIRCKGEGY